MSENNQIEKAIEHCEARIDEVTFHKPWFQLVIDAAKRVQELEKERDENHKAYQTVKDWAHRLEYKLIALMEKCEEAAMEEPAGSFPDTLVGLMNDLDVNNCDMAKVLQQLSQLRTAYKDAVEALLHVFEVGEVFKSCPKCNDAFKLLSNPLAIETLKKGSNDTR